METRNKKWEISGHAPESYCNVLCYDDSAMQRKSRPVVKGQSDLVNNYKLSTV